RNIACGAYQLENGWELRCDVSRRSWNVVPTDPDCEGDSGDALGLHATGAAYAICHGDTYLGDGRVLGYGSTWRRGPFTCLVEASGVTCRNRQGHGFTVSRQRYRYF
ncbi:MAG TPA: DUF6636 domain-containing protein, partial [Longimicrobiaceae bacterium]